MGIEYQELEVEISEREDGRCVARVLASAVGRVEETEIKPAYVGAEIDKLLDALGRRVRNTARDRRDLVPAGQGRSGTAQVDERVIGTRLFESIFRGEIRSAYDRSLGRVDRSVDDTANTGLRLRLSFNQAAERSGLAALPWELLFHDGRVLARQRHAPVVRRMSQGQAGGSLLVRGPIRVLVVDAAPENLTELDSKRELEAIKSALKDPLSAEVRTLEHPSPEQLSQDLIDYDPHVLHFIGHGGRPGDGASARSDGSLFFEDERRRAREIQGSLVKDVVERARSLKLVVLNTCWSAAAGRTGGVTTGASIAIGLAKLVPAVVAMQFPISDHAAIILSKVLYERIAKGDPLDAAISEARLQIALDDDESLEWMTPVLFLSPDDGRLVGSSQPETRSLSLGIRSFGGDAAWGPTRQDVDEYLDLLEHFSDRWIRDPSLWADTVWPQLRSFLLEKTDRARRPVILDFAAHPTIAFAAGYCLEAKSGIDVGVMQRRQGAAPQVHRAGEGEEAEEPLWAEDHDIMLDGSASDVVYGISITRNVMPKVHAYLQQSPLNARRLVPMTIRQGPGQGSMLSGAHAMQLAGSVAHRVDNHVEQEWTGTTHLFIAAPNSFTFFLGQLARSFGKIQLYEYPFGEARHLGYRPSLLIDPGAGT